MKILAIETSCDETGIAIVETTDTGISVLSDVLLSQALKHAEYGGVYPTLAKREHSKNIGPLVEEALEKAGCASLTGAPAVCKETLDEICQLLEREPESFAYLTNLVAQYPKPNIDAIAVTRGPGLEPALWVGVNFAKALALAWDIPLIPVNHLEGHVATALATEENEHLTILQPTLPSLILLISGGHTELVLMKEWLSYERIGTTRDDAVGEAFDKAARLMGIPYPGGTEVSRRAAQAREENLEQPFTLPRPMLHDESCDFSFSGLKTAVRNLIESLGTLSETQKKQIARELEDAITETLTEKVRRAIDTYAIQSVVVGGGVSANSEIKRSLTQLTDECGISLHVATPRLATDNGLMIALAATLNPTPQKDISATGTLPLY